MAGLIHKIYFNTRLKICYVVNDTILIKKLSTLIQKKCLRMCVDCSIVCKSIVIVFIVQLHLDVPSSVKDWHSERSLSSDLGMNIHNNQSPAEK